MGGKFNSLFTSLLRRYADDYDEKELDRDWYDGEEGGATGDVFKADDAGVSEMELMFLFASVQFPTEHFGASSVRFPR